MRLFNRIEIFGRVTKDPQIREKVTDSGTNYRLVWDIAQYQGKDDTAFWNCVMFGELDYLEKECEKLQKGHMVFVAGQLKKRTNTTKTASGAVIYSDSVIVQVRELNNCEGKQDVPDSNDADSVPENNTGNADIPDADADQDADGFKNAVGSSSQVPDFDNTLKDEAGIDQEDEQGNDPEADHAEAHEEIGEEALEGDADADESSDGESYNGYD